MTLGKLLLQTLVAAGDSATFGALFQVEKRHYLACAITGAAGWVTYCLAVEAGCSVAAASFLGALPLTLLARLFAIYRRAPVTVFLLCGIFPLVPGAGIYYTAYYFLRDDRTLFLNKGVETLKIALALALGIALVCSLPLPGREHKK